MTRLSVAIFLVLTVSMAPWGFAEEADIADDPSWHSHDIQNELENENSPTFEARKGEPQDNASNPTTEGSGQKSNNMMICYSCIDCPKTHENTTATICPYTFDISKVNKCVTYAQKSRGSEKPWYIRNCASVFGSCSEIKAAHKMNPGMPDLIFCNECEGNLCNKNFGHRSLADITLAILSLVICPLVAKHTLS